MKEYKITFEVMAETLEEAWDEADEFINNCMRDQNTVRNDLSIEEL